MIQTHKNPLEPSKKQPQSYGGIKPAKTASILWGIPQQGTLAELLRDFVG
jgi:hypothetical protein